MLGVRRYRVFLLVAALTAASLYYLVNRHNGIGQFGSIGYRGSGHGSTYGQHADQFLGLKKPPGNPVEFPPEPLQSVPSNSEPRIPETKPLDPVLPVKPKADNEKEKAPLIDQEPVSGEAKQEQPKKDAIPIEKQDNLVDQTQSQWPKHVEHFPIAKKDLKTLPRGQVKQLPKIQFEFEPESATARKDRMWKQSIIRKSFGHAWAGYKRYAQPHDELKPLSKEGIDRKQFLGWGATLVDTLDTLWIMGLYDDFEDAVAEVAKIDFKSSEHDRISMFETTIRYLGGLLSAYDLSLKKYPILLEKATDLGEVLIGAFDTPNRMPIPYYYPGKSSEPQRSTDNTVLAEIGSMSMEFTRLAQLTGENKFYDAIARVTDALEEWQMETKMPGLWPLHLDSSGCRKIEKARTEHNIVQTSDMTDRKTQSKEQYGSLLDGEEPAIVPPSKVEGTSNQPHRRQIDDAPLEPKLDQLRSPGQKKRPISAPADKMYQHKPLTVVKEDESKDKMQESASTKEKVTTSQAKQSEVVQDDGFVCEPQGLRPEPFWGMHFGIGGQADSVYEYLPKMFALLGGVSSQYETMYGAAMKTIRSKLLFRPMIEDAKRNVLFAAKYEIEQHEPDPSKQIKIHWEGTHLTCFAGGMVALGSRLFNIPSDMDIAKRLTDGCVWAYESMPTGIMAEDFEVVPCDSEQSCPWSEKKWHQALDPDQQERFDVVETWNKNQKAMYDAFEASNTDVIDDMVIQTAPNKPQATMFKGAIKKDHDERLNKREEFQDGGAPTKTSSDVYEDPNASSWRVSFTPLVALPHEEYVKAKIVEDHLFPGYTNFKNPSYILRPEAIESVFTMWRLTGEEYWRQKGWKMFQSVEAATETDVGNAALRDVRSVLDQKTDSMESFWLAETLKYYYLLFSEPELISLDDYVLNTEAHPFRLNKPTTLRDHDLD